MALRPWVTPGLVLGMSALIPAVAKATPRWHPFTYTTSTLPAGSTELEFYADVAPGTRTVTGPMGTAPVTYDGAYFQPQIEIEHGVTDRLQLSMYNVFKQPNGGPFTYDGVRLEGIYRFSGETWPIQAAALVEFGYAGDSVELEERLLLESVMGKVRINANLWVEQEFGRRADRRDLDMRYRPSLAVGYEITPAVRVGAEYWGLYHDVPVNGGGDTAFQMLHYAGPTLSLISGEWWVSAGVYARLYQPSSLVTGSDDELTYNSVWTRLVVGGTL